MKLTSFVGLVNFGILLNFISCQVTKAQIVPDNSLPDNSVVTPDGEVIQIEGGTRRGDNLFHSFEEFSVSTDGIASFNNAAEIQNIFSRVTGSSISKIDGILEAQGAASLFLINPNGIIFGEDAALNIGGSFLATTAKSLVFEDGTQFNTTQSQTTPLLTITAPVGLGLGVSPRQIVSRSRALSFTNESEVGLQVQPENTLALLGGEITLDGGLLTANGGRIELGGVADENIVSLISDDKGWKLDYEAIASFQDINLSQGSALSSLSDAGGNIQVYGKNISLIKGSEISLIGQMSEAGNLVVKGSESVILNGFGSGLFNIVEESTSGETRILNIETKQLSILNGASIFTATSGTGAGVEIEINASELIEIEGVGITEDGLSSSSFLKFAPSNQAENNTIGNKGSLTLETKKLTIENGGQISTTTFSQGDAGNLTIIASDSILLKGRDFENNIPSGIFAQVEGEGTGDAGNLSIETSQLTVLDGAQISTAAKNNGQGGNIDIDVSNSILLSGTSPLGNVEKSESAIFTSAQPGATGNSGNLELNAGLLIVEEGAVLSANNRGTGEGGNADINIDRAIVRDGGEIGAGSLVDDDAVDDIRGAGGTLTINANDSIEVVRTGTIRDETVNSTIFTRSEGTGDSGNLNIYTPNLTVADSGNIDVGATGTGEAGSLSINASDIVLDRGSLTAKTRAGDRGNITLNNADTLLLDNNSQITTNATESATGGNIAISSDGIALLDNSDITANAVRGQGGNIQITTQGIFLEPNSEISATSELGIDGTVTFNTPDVDPTSGIFELPDVPLNAEAILAQNLCKSDDEIAKGSSFIITGKGGLTPTSTGSLSNRDRLVDWASRDDLAVSDGGTVAIRQRENRVDKTYPDIQQSQGLVVAADGSTWLTANNTNANTQNKRIVHPDCGNLHNNPNG